MAVQNYKNIFINITPQEQPEESKQCWFRKNNIKHVDYKDPDFLLTWVNEQGHVIPRRITGTSQKYQKRLAQAIKRSRHLALMPFTADSIK